MRERPESYLITDDRRRIIHTHAGEKVGQWLTDVFFQIKYNIIHIDDSSPTDWTNTNISVPHQKGFVSVPPFLK